MQDLANNEIIIGFASAVAGYGVWILKHLAINIESLNEKMAIVVLRLGVKEKTIDDHEERLRFIERTADRLKAHDREAL